MYGKAGRRKASQRQQSNSTADGTRQTRGVWTKQHSGTRTRKTGVAVSVRVKKNKLGSGNARCPEMVTTKLSCKSGGNGFDRPDVERWFHT